MGGGQEGLAGHGLPERLELLGAEFAVVPGAGEEGVGAGDHLLDPEEVDERLGERGDAAVVDAAEGCEEFEVDGDQVGVVVVHGLLLVVVAAVHEGALRREPADRVAGRGDGVEDLGRGVVLADVGELPEPLDRLVGPDPLPGERVGGAGAPGEDLRAEPPFLLEAEVHEVRRLSGLLGQQSLAGLPLEVEEGLAAGDAPEGDEGDAGDEGEDEQGCPQRHRRCRTGPP